jgi:hypothetical protein
LGHAQKCGGVEKNTNNAAINIQDIGFVIKISSVKP